MLNLILRLLITVIALKGADFLLPNFDLFGGFWRIFFFAVVLGLLNWIVKPILVFFSIPFLIVTIGFFYFLINAFVIYLASLLMPDTLSATFFGVFFGSILVSLFHWMLSILFRVKKHD